MRRLVRLIGTLMIVAGVCMLAWAITIWQWQDPFTAAMQELEQRQLEQSFERQVDLVERTPAEPVAGDAQTVQRGAPPRRAGWRKSSDEGDAIARLRIPDSA